MGHGGVGTFHISRPYVSRDPTNPSPRIGLILLSEGAWIRGALARPELAGRHLAVARAWDAVYCYSAIRRRIKQVLGLRIGVVGIFQLTSA